MNLRRRLSRKRIGSLLKSERSDSDSNVRQRPVLSSLKDGNESNRAPGLVRWCMKTFTQENVKHGFQMHPQRTQKLEKVMRKRRFVSSWFIPLTHTHIYFVPSFIIYIFFFVCVCIPLLFRFSFANNVLVFPLSIFVCKMF